MLLWIDWEPIMPAITAVLVFGTVVLGIAGLYSDNHTQDKKLTRSGWQVASLMVLLGILTVLSGLANQRIVDAKEQALAKERTRQFQAQIGALRRVTVTLGGVTGSLTDLQGDMRESLGTQRKLFDKADENLRASADLQQQSQANTLSVLRRVFEESNRVSAERVAISVVYHCPPTEELDYEAVKLRRATISVRNAVGGQAARLSTGSLVELSDGSVFHGFLGDLGPYEAFQAWKNARVSVTIEAYRYGRPFTMSDLKRYEEVKERLGGKEPDPPVCPTTMMLFLNGRQVANSAADLRTSDKFKFVASFPDLRINPARLPSFPR